MSKKDFVKIEIALDEQKIPSSIHWSASGNNGGEKQEEAKAFFLTFFDPETRETMEMDLWTNKMQMIEMDRFVFQTLGALTNLYFRATKNKDLANDMQKFVQHFGKQTEILTK